MSQQAQSTEFIEQFACELNARLGGQPTASNPNGLLATADWVESRLLGVGFEVQRLVVDKAPPILLAVRPGHGGTLGLAGHYDVEEAGDGWTFPAFEVSQAQGRVFGRGTADNLGPLLLRILTLEHYRATLPTIVWVLQGQEEVGSPAAHQLYPQLRLPPVDLWLEETGYFEKNGDQRLLARHLNDPSRRWIEAVITTAKQGNRDVALHDRYLNKAFGEQQCPFLKHLVNTTPYLAIGPNDPDSRIHRPDESLPLANLALSRAQFEAVLNSLSETTSP